MDKRKLALAVRVVGFRRTEGGADEKVYVDERSDRREKSKKEGGEMEL